MLNRTREKQQLYWFKTLTEYYERTEWELYDLKMDPIEVNNIVGKPSYKKIFEELGQKLFEWQKKTEDPWICSPHAVLENQKCMSLLN